MEKDVLEQLYRRHMKAVYLYLFSLCRDHELAEDLTQETFLRALCSLESAGRELLPWLLTVARNLYLDTWRRKKRLNLQDGGGNHEKEAGGGKGILELMIQKEQNQRIVSGNTEAETYGEGSDRPVLFYGDLTGGNRQDPESFIWKYKGDPVPGEEEPEEAAGRRGDDGCMKKYEKGKADEETRIKADGDRYQERFERYLRGESEIEEAGEIQADIEKFQVLLCHLD